MLVLYDEQRMTKRGLLERIRAHLSSELEALSAAALSTYEGATSEEAKAENKYDTRALESSYLAGAQARRVTEVQDMLVRYQALPVRSFDDDQPIAMTALVKLECEGADTWYFIGPCAGGIKVEHEGRDVLVITPAAPLGKLLIGKQVGECVTTRGRDRARTHEIIEVL